jgi:hypothetical protein
MNEPWFNPNLYAWIPGTFLGLLGGVFGVLVGTMAPRGRGKRLVFGFIGFTLAYSALLLVAGIGARLSGQPYGIWYGLGLPGVIGLLVIGLNTPGVIIAYRKAEQRRIEAQDLTH